MRIRDFQLERYFAKYEFSVAHLLSPSDCETWSIGELLDLEAGDPSTRLKELRLSYTESRGNPGLLDVLDELYGVGREGIVTGCPEELIFLFMNSFLERGDKVVCISPAYQSLYELPRSIGCEVVFWRLRAENGRWHTDVDELKSLLCDSRLLVLNFPHNPTGYMPDVEQFTEIVDMAANMGVTVFSDEMYRGLELDSPSLPSLAGWKNAVVLAGLSKGPGLPGLRVGWLASRRHDLVSAAAAMKDYTTICNSAPSEFLAELALRNIDTLLKRNRDILRANAELAREFFARRAEIVEWIPAAGGPTAFPRLLTGNVEEMCDLSAADKSLMILPDKVFDVSDGRFRVGMGRRIFPVALTVFGEFLESWKTR
jgi:aspartate/methionine/tyrosine aminotransferase